MPIKVSRPNRHSQTERMTYGQAVRIKDAVHEYLSANPCYGFTADVLSARISEPAAPAMIETVLSQHPDEFDHTVVKDGIYWYTPKE